MILLLHYYTHLPISDAATPVKASRRTFVLLGSEAFIKIFTIHLETAWIRYVLPPPPPPVELEQIK